MYNIIMSIFGLFGKKTDKQKETKPINFFNDEDETITGYNSAEKKNELDEINKQLEALDNDINKHQKIITQMERDIENYNIQLETEKSIKKINELGILKCEIQNNLRKEYKIMKELKTMKAELEASATPAEPAPIVDISPQMIKKPLHQQINDVEPMESNITEITESEDENKEEQADEGIEEEQQEIKEPVIAGIDTRANQKGSDGVDAEPIEVGEPIEQELTPADLTPSLDNLPAPIKEETKAVQKLASNVVANHEPEKSLTLIKNTLSNLPIAIFPQVADNVANTLMDAKDENGVPIFESKKEIIKLLKDLRNSKQKKSTKSGSNKGRKSGKNKHERDYLDYMYSKRINPVLLITPKMRR